MAKTGLLVEGGGMKCAYSAGVLDAFMENGITFDYVIGVSAGAANAASFMAGQIGRNKRFYTEFVTDPEYFGVKSFLKTHDGFNLKYIYGDLTNEGGAAELYYDKVMENPAEYEIVATNAITGKPHYFKKEELKRNDYKQIMASSAIPALCRPVFIDKVPYYDGGISDALPLRRAFDCGCERVVCLLSKSRNYIKKPEKMKAMYTIMCKKYPNTIKNMNNRYIMYKREQDFMYKAEKKGRAFIFSLETDLKLSTYTMDPNINGQLYDLGVQDFHEKEEALKEFLRK